MKHSKSLENEEDIGSAGCGCCINRHPHLDDFFGEIANESTAHGVKYIGSKKLRLIERVFWTVVMLASLGYSIYLVESVYSKFHDNPVIISFQSDETSVSQIPFPAVTICNLNLLKTSVLSKEYDNFVRLAIMSVLQQSGPTDEMFGEAAHLDHLGQYCLQTMSFRRILNETLKDANGRKDFIQTIITELKGFNDSITAQIDKAEHSSDWWKAERHIFGNATINCDEMLLQCMWAGDLVQCKDVFFPIETRQGRCCVFNMMPKFILQNISVQEGRAKKEMNDIPIDVLSEWKTFGKDDLVIKDMDRVAKIKYPKHQKICGKPYGLTVLLNPNLQDYSTCTSNDGWGFKIVAHSPISSPNIMEYGAAIPPRSEVFVDIEPQITVANEDLLNGIPIEKRGCFLSTDYDSKLAHYYYYSPENCFSECLADHTYRNCSCVRYFMPRNASQKLCGAKDRDCTDDVRGKDTDVVLHEFAKQASLTYDYVVYKAEKEFHYFFKI